MATRDAYRNTTVAQLNTWLKAGDTVVFQNSGTWLLDYPGSNTGAINMGSGAKITKAAGVGEVILKMGKTSRTYQDLGNHKKAAIGPQWTAVQNPDERGMISAVNVDTITIENITIDGDWGGSTYLGSGNNITVCFTGSSNITINNCIFRNGQSDFIRTRRCNGVTIANCAATYSGHEFLYSLYSNNIKFLNNNIITRTNSGCRLAGSCATATICGNTIDGNLGRPATGGHTGPLIEINIGAGSNIHIRNNILKNATGAGIWFFAETCVTATNIYVYDNTFTNLGHADGNGWTNGAIVNGHVKNIVIERNSFDNCGPTNKPTALKIYNYRCTSGSTTMYFRNNTGIQTFRYGSTGTNVKVFTGTANGHTIITTGSSVTTKTGCGSVPIITTPPTSPNDPPITTDPPVIKSPTINYSVGGLQIDGVHTQPNDQPSYNIIRGYKFDLTTYIENAVRAYIRKYDVTARRTNPNAAATLISTTTLFINGTGAKVTSKFSETMNFTYDVAYTISAYPSSSEDGKVFKNITVKIIEPAIPIPTFKEFFSAVGGKQRNQIYNTESVSIIANGFENVEKATIQIATEPDGLTVYENIPIINNGIRLDGITFTGTGDRLCKLLLANSKSGSATSEFYINVAAPPSVITPALSFTSNYNSIYANDSIKLTWLTADATAISLKYTDGVTTDANIVIPQPYDVEYGSVYLSPAMTTSYTMTAYNGSLSKSYTLEVTVNNRPPDVYPAIRLRSSTPRIDIDQSAVIEWLTENVETLSCSGYDSLPPISGSITVSPQSNTKYIFTGYGPDETGVTTASITIYVNRSDIVGAFVASPQIVHSGEPTTLAWMTRYAKDIYIDGVLMPSGSASAGTYVVTPTYPTTYTLLASGSMGTFEKTFDVDVMNPPGDEDIAAYFSVSNPLIMRGRTSEISWLAQNANMMSTDYEHQFVELPSGSLIVKPPISMNYQFILAKEFETAEYEVPIYVINDNYEFITSDTYQRPEEFIDISARAVYVSGGQSTTDTTYTWNVDANEAIRANPTDEMITFSFDEKGFYTITLTSVDRNGMIKMQTVRANVYI